MRGPGATVVQNCTQIILLNEKYEILYFSLNVMWQRTCDASQANEIELSESKQVSNGKQVNQPPRTIPAHFILF
jgi:hypothetical protein